MAENNKRVHWEVEDEEEESDYQSSQPSAQSYLNEEFILKLFNQGRDDAESSSNSRCPISLKLSKTPSFLNSVRKSVAKGRLSKTKAIEKPKAGNFPAASIMIGSLQGVQNVRLGANSGGNEYDQDRGSPPRDVDLSMALVPVNPAGQEGAADAAGEVHPEVAHTGVPAAPTPYAPTIPHT